VIDEPCASVDVFPTVLTAASVPLPDDRVLDGKDLVPVLTAAGTGAGTAYPERALYGMQGANLMTIRKGRFKLHVTPPQRTRYMENADDWVDPRAPDGVTILAPAEQYRPNQYPGVLTGDEPAPMMLFDLEHDPAEQHNVAAKYPDVVGRLRAEFETTLAQFPPEMRPAQPRRARAP
jgi:uncharacterized sulfatase